MICLLPLVLALAPRTVDGASIGADALDPNAPYAGDLSAPVTYQVDFRAVVTAPHHTRVLEVWMPIPPDDGVQSLTRSELETWPLEVTPEIGIEPLYGNRFAYFRFENPKGAQMIRHRFDVTTHELRFDVDAARVERVETWPESFGPYLRSEERAVEVTSDERALAADVVGQPGGGFGDFAAVVDWIESNMSYDHSRASLQASSAWALSNRTGHCSDYHGLCSALGRALGYPTRVAYGINGFPKDSPSHCKAEVYLPPYGWVSFDLSETQKLVGRIESDASLSPERRAQLEHAALARLFSGFRDNTWILWTRGSDYELAPPAKSRVAVVRTIYAEADGEALPEPDPGDATRREYGWMTLHDFVADREVSYPFADLGSLATWIDVDGGSQR
jgi:transglutaminase-like putative cysteine protease